MIASAPYTFKLRNTQLRKQAPMRQSQRRRLLIAARAQGEREVAAVVLASLQKQFRVLKRELRHANLRKRLKKTDGLYKAEGDWQWWIDEFSQLLTDILAKVAVKLTTIEDLFFAPSGKAPQEWDFKQVVQDYQDRVGLKITNLAGNNLADVQKTIAEWYQGQGTLPELIQQLEDKNFSPYKAELIAATEMNFLASEISLKQMQYMGISRWIWDAFADACILCLGLQAQSLITPFKVGDPMPPDASHPHCECGVLYANSNGTPLTYGEEE